MAISIVSSSTTSATVRGPVWQTVLVKPSWDAEWTYVPYLHAEQVTEAVAPTMGTARLRYDFGRILREDTGYFAQYDPLSIDGYYVAIWVHDSGGSAALWYGIVISQDYDIYGDVAPSGKQIITANELGHVLDRQSIIGSYTEDGYIDRPLTFNGGHGFGQQTSGNMGDIDGATNAHQFGTSDVSWSNARIAAHLLEYHRPSGIYFVLAGQLNALDGIIERHDLQGLTLWQALNRLIDRRRGLGFRVLSYGDGICAIFVFSISAVPIAGFPANNYQVAINFDNALDLEPKFTYSSIDRYARIVAMGGPIKSCFTVGYGDSTLVEGWNTADENAYRAALGDDAAENDAERATDKYKHVFQLHRLALTSWSVGGTVYAPKALDNGSVDPTTAQPRYWPAQRTLERSLPIEEPGTPSGLDVEYRKPFALIPVDSRYQFVDRLDEVDRTPAGVYMGDKELAIRVEARPNHMFAFNHWDTETDGATQHAPTDLDYEDMVATVFVETDERIRAVYDIPTGYSNRDALGVKVINVPELETWFIADGTTTDVTDGAAVQTSGYSLPRDDGRLLDSIASTAAAWYSIPRGTLTFEHDGISIALPSITMVRGITSGWRLTPVNSPITSRTWDFTAPGFKTRYTTGHDELAFKEVAMGGESA